MNKKVLFAGLILSLSSATYADTYTEADLIKEANLLNKDYPIMVDEATKLTNVSVDSSTWRYHYQMVNVAAADLNVDKFNKMMREMLIKHVCTDKFAKNVFESNFSISFDYVDKNNDPLTNITFKGDDCKDFPVPAKPASSTDASSEG